jgi:anti-anti-sigma factor
MPDLAIDIQDLPGLTGAKRVALSGAIDGRTILSLRSEVSACQERGVQRFVVDMEQVKYVNSTGLSFFITLAGEGERLALVKVQPKVKIVFDMMGLGSLFKMVDSTEEAARHVGAGLAPAAAPAAAAAPDAPPRRGLGLAVALALAAALLLAVSLYLSGAIPGLHP